MFCMFSVDNGLSPVWSESCEFDVINPSVALLRFVVQDMDMFGDPNFLGQATFPLLCIRSGWYYSSHVTIARCPIRWVLFKPRFHCSVSDQVGIENWLDVSNWLCCWCYARDWLYISVTRLILPVVTTLAWHIVTHNIVIIIILIIIIIIMDFYSSFTSEDTDTFEKLV